MRNAIGGLLLTLACAPVPAAAPVNPSPVFHISGASVLPMRLVEWDADGPMGRTVQIAWDDAVDKAPPNASRYQQKTYSFPTGTIRLLEFRKETGGMVHAITSETAIFMLRGVGSVEVAGKTVTLGAGDAVNYPSGVLRGAGDASVLAWTVTGTVNNEASPAMLLRASSAGGDVRHYAFPGTSVRWARRAGRAPDASPAREVDSLVYVIAGRLKFTQGGKAVEALPGDAIREIAGQARSWSALAPSSFVAIDSLPVGAATGSSGGGAVRTR